MTTARDIAGERLSHVAGRLATRELGTPATHIVADELNLMARRLVRGRTFTPKQAADIIGDAYRNALEAER
jgi:hypothetical protein